MSKPKVFIDGESGTVGLQIYERLENRSDIELLKISPELCEDADERKKFLNSADFVFLCLPDDIARGAVEMLENPNVRVIDASTAHRTNPNWTYGFPELSANQAEKIRNSKRVANPGCYASGFIALVYPLVQSGMLPRDYPFFCYGISGYSGAGKAFIDEYQNKNRNPELNSARLYALSQTHKHQPEMKTVCGLKHDPMFNPVIDDYYNGMIVCVPLQRPAFTIDEVRSMYNKHYTNGKIKLIDGDDITFLASNTMSGSDDMELYVFGNNERILLTARFDNLGKGASGAAVQCFDLMKG